MSGRLVWNARNAPALVWMLGGGYCILLHERSVYACELREHACECEYEDESEYACMQGGLSSACCLLFFLSFSCDLL